MKKEIDNNVPKCWWCGAPLPCECGYCKEELPALNWDRILEVFGPCGLPSCGMTDAGRLGSCGNDETVFIGGDKKKNWLIKSYTKQNYE